MHKDSSASSISSNGMDVSKPGSRSRQAANVPHQYSSSGVVQTRSCADAAHVPAPVAGALGANNSKSLSTKLQPSAQQQFGQQMRTVLSSAASSSCGCSSGPSPAPQRASQLTEHVARFIGKKMSQFPELADSVTTA